MTVKIFVGNIAPGTDTVQLRELFEQHGSVTECDVLGGYGFVHMESEAIATEAIKALAGCSLNGSRLNIELSTATTQGRARLAARATSTVKVFVGNLSKSTTNDRLRELFETYGGVSEADVLGGFGFVHMHQEQEAFKAIKALNGYILDGNRLNVELSTGGTQGKSKERELYSGRGIPTLPSLSARARPVTARYDPYPLPPISSRRPAVDPYETYAYSSQSSPGRGASSGDSFARDLLELYIKNRAAFDAYANDPLVRKALNLPPVESDPVYYRTPPPPSSGRDYYERRRLSELSSSVSADPYASPSDYAAAATAYDSNPAGRGWPGAGLSSSYGAGGDAMSHSAASAKGRGHLYTSFE